VLQVAEVRDKLLSQGAEASPSTAEELDAVVKEELRKWEMVIRDAKIRPE
jgi:tripartite-type tricarboxylate transporter receptor subunit TctC